MDHTKAWLAYVDSPSPKTMSGVVDALRPVILSQAVAYGGADSPTIRHKARLMAVDAIRSYDPASGTKLSTWVQSNLRGLSRYKREISSPVRVPERAQLDAWHIEKARRKFVDEYGDEPDTKQLADAASLPVKRITEVMSMTRPVGTSDSVMGGSETYTDHLGEALDYVYDSSDKIDRQIIDHTIGYGGKPILQKQEIAAKLGISPASVTRRAERIGNMAQELDMQLTKTY